MPRAGAMAPRSDRETFILKFYTLLMAKEFDAWGELFTEDARQENRFMPALPGLDAEFVGRERIVFHYRTVLTNRRGHVFTVHAIHECAESVVVEVSGRSEVPETGRIYDQRYVMIFGLRDGRITTLREYFNPLMFQRAFEGFLVGEDSVAN